jgi:hypothetical protein
MMNAIRFGVGHRTVTTAQSGVTVMTPRAEIPTGIHIFHAETNMANPLYLIIRHPNCCLSSVGFRSLPTLGWMVQTNVEDQISISKTIYADCFSHRLRSQDAGSPGDMEMAGDNPVLSSTTVSKRRIGELR